MCESGLTIGELCDRLAHVLEAAHDVRQASGRPEVLLLKTELLADYASRSAWATDYMAHIQVVWSLG